MLSQIEVTVLYVLAIVIMSLLVTCLFLKHSRDYYKQQVIILNQGIQFQNAKIDEWKSESEKLQKQLEDTETIASDKLTTEEQADNKILTTQLPSDCQGSIKWLRDQASGFSHEPH